MDLTLPNGNDVTLSAIYHAGSYDIEMNGVVHHVTASLQDNELTCSVDGQISKQRVVIHGPNIKLFNRDFGALVFTQKVPKFLSQQLGAGSLGGAVAPMPGVIEKVSVQDGDLVNAGDPLVVMIAMKMEYVIKAPKAGKVAKVSHQVGDFVTKGTPLVEFAEEED